MVENLKFSEINYITGHDRRRIRVALKSGRVILCESIFTNEQSIIVEECEFFSHKAVDEYYNPSLNQKTVQ